MSRGMFLPGDPINHSGSPLGFLAKLSLFIIGVVVVINLAQSIGAPPKRPDWMDSTHKVLQLGPSQTSSFEIHGFYFGIAALEGQSKTERAIGFNWEIVPGDTRTSNVPLSKRSVVTDESTGSNPTIQFIWKGQTQSSEELSSANPNDLIQSDALKLVVIKSSSQIKQREPALEGI